MKKIEIQHRWRSTPVFTTEVYDVDPQPMRTAVERAAISGGPESELRELRVRTVEAIEDIDVSDTEQQVLRYRVESIDREITSPSTRADLTGAVLTRADLTGADLTGAVLTDAVLTGADLTDADLTDADLTRADLTDAVLTDADLTDAVLTGADGLPTNISDLQKPEDPLARARRRAAYAARYRERHPDVPVVPGLDGAIAARVRANRACFAMSQWHCGTTHCRAGHTIDIAGDAGYALECKVGSHRAGLMIYRASAGYSPYFFGPDEPALADIDSGARDEQLLAEDDAP